MEIPKNCGQLTKAANVYPAKLAADICNLSAATACLTARMVHLVANLRHLIGGSGSILADKACARQHDSTQESIAGTDLRVRATSLGDGEEAGRGTEGGFVSLSYISQKLSCSTLL